MKLSDDILAVMREERDRMGYALLKPYTIRHRVIERMRKRQVVRTWIFGELWELIWAPSMHDIRATIRELRKDRNHFIRVYDDEIYPPTSPHGLVAN